jgi:hypothetical protein
MPWQPERSYLYTFSEIGSYLTDLKRSIVEEHSAGEKYGLSDENPYATGKFDDHAHYDAMKLGLPQGSPLSPVLSSQYLQCFLNELEKRYPSVKFCVYADDIIFYGDNDEEFQQFTNDLEDFLSEYNLTLAIEKSQTTKLEGN